MAVTTDIVATYRGPRRVIARLLSMGHREDRLLAFVMFGCAMAFVAQMPRLAREAHLTGQELNMLLGGALLGLVFMAPLAATMLSRVLWARKWLVVLRLRMRHFAIWPGVASSPRLLTA